MKEFIDQNLEIQYYREKQEEILLYLVIKLYLLYRFNGIYGKNKKIYIF